MRHVLVLRILLAVAGCALVAGCSASDPAPPGPAPARTLDEAVVAQTFDGLSMTPFGSNGELTPDGRRALDILSIQGALVRYEAARSRYPDSLGGLSPDYMRTLPRDPDTREDYAYRSINGGTDYELHARLSNGREFFGVPLQAR